MMDKSIVDLIIAELNSPSTVLDDILGAVWNLETPFTVSKMERTVLLAIDERVENAMGARSFQQATSEAAEASGRAVIEESIRKYYRNSTAKMMLGKVVPDSLKSVLCAEDQPNAATQIQATQLSEENRAKVLDTIRTQLNQKDTKDTKDTKEKILRTLQKKLPEEQLAEDLAQVAALPEEPTLYWLQAQMLKILGPSRVSTEDEKASLQRDVAQTAENITEQMREACESGIRADALTGIMQRIVGLLQSFRSQAAAEEQIPASIAYFSYVFSTLYAEKKSTEEKKQFDCLLQSIAECIRQVMAGDLARGVNGWIATTLEALITSPSQHPRALLDVQVPVSSLPALNRLNQHWQWEAVCEQLQLEQFRAQVNALKQTLADARARYQDKQGPVSIARTKTLNEAEEQVAQSLEQYDQKVQRVVAQPRTAESRPVSATATAEEGTDDRPAKRQKVGSNPVPQPRYPTPFTQPQLAASELRTAQLDLASQLTDSFEQITQKDSALFEHQNPIRRAFSAVLQFLGLKVPKWCQIQNQSADPAAPRFSRTVYGGLDAATTLFPADQPTNNEQQQQATHADAQSPTTAIPLTPFT